MAWDAVRQKAVVFATSVTDPNFSQTWLFDGTSWSRALPQHQPPSLNGAAMTFDAVGDQVVAIGGGPTFDGTGLPTMFAWDGTDWTQLIGPRTITAAAVVFDSFRRKLVLFGGQDFNNLDQTWEY